MPKLIMSNGEIIRFKTIPLYSGSSVLNKEQSRENLLLLKSIMDKHNIFFALTAGTLLGAVREQDFIDHDEDIDLALFSRDKQKVIDILPEFLEVGFIIARYDRRNVISLMRGGDYIDLCFFVKESELIYACGGTLILSRFMEEIGELEFLGQCFKVPKDYVEFLNCEYGFNWQTPVEFFDFDKPKWLVFKLKMKERIKDFIPDFLYHRLARRPERIIGAEYMERINKYLNSNKK